MTLRRHPIRCVLLLLLVAPAVGADEERTPAELYGALFEEVQLQRTFADSKTFVDALPKSEPGSILAEYQRQRSAADFDLPAFVLRHFTPPAVLDSLYRSDPQCDVRSHTDAL